MDELLVSAIICAKNESKSLRDLLEEVKDYSDEIIVVDGQSSDKTRVIAREASTRVLSDNGMGKGDALRIGLAAAQGEYVVCIDADGSHRPEDIPRIIAPLVAGEADLVIASRVLGGSEELDGTLYSGIRDYLGNLITAIINHRFGTSLTDSQNGFRALRRDIVRSLELTENSFTIEQQMCIRSLKCGYRILEIPSHERRRRHGKSHISLLRHGPTYAWSLLREMVT